MQQHARVPRRWFQFSLRSLLILMTLVVGLLVCWRSYVGPYWQQRRTMTLIEELGGSYRTVAADDWLRRLYGDDLQNVILVDLSNADGPATYLDAIVCLPCLSTLIVGGHNFTDEELRRLKRVSSLRNLVLDSTAVTSQGVSELQQALPNLHLHLSQRRAIEALTTMGKVRSVPISGQAELRRLVGDGHFAVALEAQVSGVRGDADMVHLHGLTALQRLEVWNTSVTNAGVARLKRLSNLQELSLDETRLTDAGLVNLRGLTRLRKLSLEGTYITDAGLAHLALLSNLQELYLYRTLIAGPGIAHLKHTDLQMLSLGRTAITDDGLAHLKGLRNLRCLWLRDTRISGAGLAHLTSLTKLQTLSLWRTEVGDVGLEHLQALSSLGSLALDNTHVTDDGLAYLGGLTNLKELSLSGTRVSDAGLQYLKGLTNLRLLFVGNTGVTERGVDELRQALPKCEIAMSGVFSNVVSAWLKGRPLGGRGERVLPLFPPVQF